MGPSFQDETHNIMEIYINDLLRKGNQSIQKKKHCRIYSPESVIIGDLAHIKSGLSAEHGIASFLSGESMGLVD